MADKTVRVSDLSGDLADVRIIWSVAGKSYQLDLTEKESDEFHNYLEKYTSVSKTLKKGARSRSAGSGTDSGVSLADVRVWARENGYEVSDRGVVKAEIMEAYKAAQ